MVDFASQLRSRKDTVDPATGVAATPAPAAAAPEQTAPALMPLTEDMPAQESAIKDVKGEGGGSFSERLRQRNALAQSGVHTTSPGDEDTYSREAGLKAAMAEKGIKVERLGEPGLPDLGMRFDLGLSDTFNEKREKFLSKHPEGDFIEVDEPPAVRGRAKSGTGGKTVMFRRSATEPFAEVDARVIDKFELIGDTADIAGDVPAMVAQAIMTRGSSIATQIMQVMAGQVVGDSAKEIFESLRGFQLENFSELTSRIGGRAIVSGVGAAATGTVTGPLNAFRGAGSIKLLPGAKDAQKAALAMGIPAFLPNQIAASPIIRRLGAQSKATVSTIGEYLRKQQTAAVAAFTRMNDDTALKVASMTDVEAIHTDAIKQIMSAVKQSKDSLTDGGTALQNGICEYEDLSGTIVNRLYEDARGIDTPKFDISPVLAVARNVKAGVLAKGKGEDVPTGILDADGNAIMKASDETVQLKPVDARIAREIEKLEAIDPSLPSVKMPDGREITATDQLLAIRSNLWELKQISPIGTATPEDRAAAAQAEKLYSGITHVLKNPKNADQNFVAAWSKAQGEAARRFDTLEKMIIVQSTKTEAPTQLAARLAQPLQVDNLKILQETLPADKYRIFQNSVKNHFLEPQNINGLTKRLDKFDKNTLDRLLTPQDQADLRFVGQKVDLLNKVGIKKAIEDQNTVRSAIVQLTNRDDGAGMNEFIRRIEFLPPDSKQRRLVRASVIDDLYQKVVLRTDKGQQVSGPTLVKEIDKLKKNGLFERILTSDDRRILTNFDKLGFFLNVAEDSGTSLQAASVAANIREGNIKGFKTLIETMSTGRFFTSSYGQRLLLGSGKDKLPFARTRVVGAILAQEADYLRGSK